MKEQYIGSNIRSHVQDIKASKSPKTDDLSKKKTNYILEGKIEPLDRSQLAQNKTLFVFLAIQLLLCQDEPIRFHQN